MIFLRLFDLRSEHRYFPAAIDFALLLLFCYAARVSISSFCCRFTTPIMPSASALFHILELIY